MNPNGKDAEKLAVSYFDSGFNCAESTLKAVCEAAGIENERVPAIASAFGAGIGRRGYTCGVISGAAVAVGLLLGRMKPTDERGPSYDTMGRFVDEFVGRFGGVMCKDISGVDFLTEEGRRLYKEHAHAEKCCPAVRFAVSTICCLLADAGPAEG